VLNALGPTGFALEDSGPNAVLPSSTATIQASCPTGSLAISGGYRLGGPTATTVGSAVGDTALESGRAWPCRCTTLTRSTTSPSTSMRCARAERRVNRRRARDRRGLRFGTAAPTGSPCGGPGCVQRR
jgi:hypothetical protein